MKHIGFILTVTALPLGAQVITPVPSTGYNLDAVAETTTAIGHTGGAIDGSDYVMYSASYASFYSGAIGLPNSGSLTVGTRTYQLQTYTLNNVLYLTAGQQDSLSLVTPGAYAGLSLAGFATEGTGSMNIKIRFTDNSIQTISNQSFPDWFNTGNTITSGFDRCTRTSGNPNYQTTQPKMFYLDLVIDCSNRSKQVSRVLIQNSGSSSRICVMAISGAAMPAFTVATSPVTCANGLNGSATITPTGGISPFGYTIQTNPVQTSSVASNLAVGNYSYLAQDGGACPLSGTFAITQSLVAQPALSVVPSSSVICAGATVTISTSGANTYSWSTGNNQAQFTLQPTASTVINVSGTTAQNCIRSGSVQVTVNSLPQPLFTSSPGSVCISSGTTQLAANPPGGVFSGPGVQGSSWNPIVAGVGTVILHYFYTDANSCSNSTTVSASVYSLAPPTVGTTSAVCAGSPTYQLIGNPTGGVFTGTNVSAGGVVTPIAPGNYQYTYAISNVACTVGTQGFYQVNPTPTVAISGGNKFFCNNAKQVPLSVNPGGGVLSGPGINGTFFNPATAGIGTHTISYSYTNTSKCSASASVMYTVSLCEGISENQAQDLRIFPDPADQVLNLTWVPGDGATNIQISDLSGRLIYSESFDTRFNSVRIAAEQFQAGVYIVKMAQGTRNSELKFVVQH